MSIELHSAVLYNNAIAHVQLTSLYVTQETIYVTIVNIGCLADLIFGYGETLSS